MTQGSAEDNPIPWKFGGYEKIDELYLKYWSASRDALEDAQNITNDDFSSEISEIWYSKSTQRFRVDKYVEKNTVKCNKFKGKTWETITEDGKEYVLKERRIQSGTKRTMHYLENIMSGGGTELGEYKFSESTGRAPVSLKDALFNLTLSPYMSAAEQQELIVSGLELDKVNDKQSE